MAKSQHRRLSATKSIIQTTDPSTHPSSQPLTHPTADQLTNHSLTQQLTNHSLTQQLTNQPMNPLLRLCCVCLLLHFLLLLVVLLPLRYGTSRQHLSVEQWQDTPTLSRVSYCCLLAQPYQKVCSVLKNIYRVCLLICWFGYLGGGGGRRVVPLVIWHWSFCPR